MTYSSAWFGGSFDQSLLMAQNAKYERILNLLQPQPGARILEIGCGWGGFAEAAARRGCSVHGITLSREQLHYAQERIRRGGFDTLVELEFLDYRDLQGQYDHIVSIEMLEAVGERFWPHYFAQVFQCLKPGGTAVIQTITIANERFEQYREGTDFIQQYIFPGGMLPSPAVLETHISAAGFSLEHHENFGPDYAETLRRWRNAFEASLADIILQGFDASFIRLWRFYLCYCEAAFDEAATGVVHVRVRKPL
jgi:cyclopropane-fatty-acyl-phospholipid synthase